MGLEQGSPLLAVKDLEIQVSVNGTFVPAVTQVNFDLDKGMVLGLVGESGSGKSLTCSSILRLHNEKSVRVSGGEIRWEGTDLMGLRVREMNRIRGNEISMVFQEPMTSLNPAFTIGHQITEVLRRHRKLTRRAAEKVAIEALDMVRIPDAASRIRQYPHELSGGMRQRVMIAMAVVTRPKLLIADEPTTALDVTVQAEILRLIRTLSEELGMAVLLVTHDLGVVADLCDRTIVMYGGQIVEVGPTGDLFGAPRQPYTASLMRARPSVEDSGDLYVIPGRPPRPGEVRDSCRFAARCEYVQPACTAGDIPLVPVDEMRLVRCVRWTELELGGVHG